MKEIEILNAIEALSCSQGSYGRLLRSLRELKHSDPDAYRECMGQLEAQNFKDILDLVLYFES